MLPLNHIHLVRRGLLLAAIITTCATAGIPLGIHISGSVEYFINEKAEALRVCNDKSNVGMIEEAISVRPTHVQRANRKPEHGELGAQYHGGLN